MANTPAPVAPSAFIVAMTSRLRARWLAPHWRRRRRRPAARSRPTSVRNWREALDVAFELRRGLVAGADVPAGIRELLAAPASRPTRRRASLASLAGRRSRYCQRTRLPGCNSPLARKAASLISRRGPKPMPPASLSGSLVSAARISIVALPTVMRSPGLRSSRASSAGSAAAPKTPSLCASSVGERHRPDRS